MNLSSMLVYLSILAIGATGTYGAPLHPSQSLVETDRRAASDQNALDDPQRGSAASESGALSVHGTEDVLNSINGLFSAMHKNFSPAF